MGPCSLSLPPSLLWEQRTHTHLLTYSHLLTLTLTGTHTVSLSLFFLPYTELPRTQSSPHIEQDFGTGGYGGRQVSLHCCRLGYSPLLPLTSERDHTANFLWPPSETLCLLQGVKRISVPELVFHFFPLLES